MILKDLTVLYVEDEEEVRNSVSIALKRRVSRVLIAENGEIGLEKCTTHHPDMVITDLEMPVMNGLIMIEKIKELCDRTCPIIVITAYRDEEHYTPLADAYLYKPVLIHKLEDLMVDLIQKKKQSDIP